MKKFSTLLISATLLGSLLQSMPAVAQVPPLPICPLTGASVFNQQYIFVQQSGASAAGPYRSTPHHAQSVTVGPVTITGVAADHSGPDLVTSDQHPVYANPLPGLSLFVSGEEDLDVRFAFPVYGFGFDFYEPHADATTANVAASRIVDSLFRVTLLSGTTPVGSFDFNAPNDVASFVGVWSPQPFDRATIREVVGTNDNEVFGTFYITTNSPNCTVPPPPPPPAPQCRDGIDNDGDGKIDSFDPGCTSFDDNSEVDPLPPPPQCSDGLDNDGDGKVDGFDPGCTHSNDNDETNVAPPAPQCSDGIDNDGDGKVDGFDPGCTSTVDNDEFNAAPQLPQCSDGIDNDGDGKVDGFDPGCTSSQDNDETNVAPPAPQCRDGIDNDGDGMIDSFDPGCTSFDDNDETNVTTVGRCRWTRQGTRWVRSC